MKSRIKAVLKSNKLFYYVYYYLGSFILRVWGLFLKIHDKQVLFVVYGGKKYDDSPRFVYEEMIKNDKFKDWDLIWAFEKPDDFSQVKTKVKIDTPVFYKKAMTSKYWFTNSGVSRGLNYKKKATRNIMFQHGTVGIKRLGNDFKETKGTFKKIFHEDWDTIFIQGKHEIDILSKAWGVDKEIFVNIGLPRNDDLANVSQDEIDKIKKNLNIPKNKKVILYTPTFRETSRDGNNVNVLKIPFDFNKWKQNFSDDYIMLITAHYEVAKMLNDVPNDNFVINAFRYPYINDLLKAADIMITDYSSVVFDYSILEKPIFCYAYDYDTYSKERGFYTDPNNLYSHGAIQNEDDLINSIKTMNYDKECEYTKKEIKEKFIRYYDGKSTERCIKYLYENFF